MKKEVIIYTLLSIFILLSISFASAQILQSGFSTPNITNPDSFYSPSELLNFSINVTATDSINISWVKANFSTINSTACGGEGYVNLTMNYASGFWEGYCNVSTLMNATAKASLTTPFVGLIYFTAQDNTSTVNSTNTSSVPLSVLFHNLGTPTFGPPCMRFGSLTTNFSTVNNFARVNFMVDVEMNFSCFTNGQLTNVNYIDVHLINLTSVNISNRTQAEKVMSLGTAINVTIVPPKTFGKSRIYVNTSFFTELNTNAIISFFRLPFESSPYIIEGGDGKLNATYTTWVPNGYDATFNITTGNLTFNITGFSDYNITDNVTPIITIHTLGKTTTTPDTRLLLNVTINGTGTSPSIITLKLDSTTYDYNSVTNTANCTNRTMSSELYNCILYPTVSQGTHTLVATAYDYGGTAGNTFVNTTTIFFDYTAPSLAVSAPANLTNTTSNVNFIWTVTDNLDTSINCSLLINSTINRTILTTGTSNITVAFTQDGTYNWSVNCTDDADGSNLSSTGSWFTIDTIPPPMTNTTNATDVNLDGNIEVNWTAVGGAFRYIIYRNSANITTINSTIQIANITESTFVDNTTIHSTNYFYKVVTVDYAGNLNLTNISYYTTDNRTANDTIPPARITNLSAFTNTDGSVTINWSAVTTDTNGNPENYVKYRIFRMAGDNSSAVNTTVGASPDYLLNVSSNSTIINYNDTSMTTGTQYVYLITTMDDANNYNNTVNVTHSHNNFTITPSACTTSYTYGAWGTCSVTSQTRTGTRTCRGGGETSITETQSCTPSSTGSAATGSSGSSTTTASTYQAQAWSQVTPDAPVTMTIAKASVPISEVKLEVTNKVTNAGVSVQALESKPTTIAEAPAATVYKYMKIEKSNMVAADIKSATITFKVEKSWLTANKIDQANVILSRYTTKWEELATEVSSSDATTVTYKATTSGFSYFAITTKSAGTTAITTPTIPEATTTPTTAAEEKKETTTPAVTPTPKPISPMILIILAIIAVIGVGAAVAFEVYKVNKNKKK